MSKLAIIIPAYKGLFLPRALQSLASQTCKDFILYIGDDNSPYNLSHIVADYKDKLNIVYKKFETNLGGQNLVAQWKRCIEMAQNEPWLWLFSDDDEMSPTCVEDFYKSLKKTMAKYDIYHFDVNVINEDSKIIKYPKPYPIVIDSYTYYRRKMRGELLSLVVENIFSREIYNLTGGFQNFDLAWGSDTATWMKFAQRKGMYTIQSDSRVLWRTSTQNISPDNSQPTVIRKTDALVDYYKWVWEFMKSHNQLAFYTSYRSFISRMRMFRKYIPQYQLRKCVSRFCSIYNISWGKAITTLLIKL